MLSYFPPPPDHANLMKSLLTARLKPPDEREREREKSSKPALNRSILLVYKLPPSRRPLSAPALSPSSARLHGIWRPLFANEKHLSPFGSEFLRNIALPSLVNCRQRSLFDQTLPDISSRNVHGTYENFARALLNTPHPSPSWNVNEVDRRGLEILTSKLGRWWMLILAKIVIFGCFSEYYEYVEAAFTLVQ